METEAPSRDAADLRLAERLRELRRARRWSLDELSALSGVSRASLSRIENGEVSPTASVLGRLAGAHGSTVSRLLADIEAEAPALVARADQPEWVDPATGFRRRSVSPPSLDFDCEVLRLRTAGWSEHRLSAAAAPGPRASSLSRGGRARTDDRGNRPSPERRRLPSLQAHGREPLPRRRAPPGALHSRACGERHGGPNHQRRRARSGLVRRRLWTGSRTSCAPACARAQASASSRRSAGMRRAPTGSNRVAPAHAAGAKLVLIATLGGEVAGTAQLDLDSMPSKRHHAEVSKVLVDPAYRRAGVARALMGEIERRRGEGGPLAPHPRHRGRCGRGSLSLARL